MAYSAPPRLAAWRHLDARDGFEVVFLEPHEDGFHIEGHTAAVEDGEAWAVEYSIVLDRHWFTRHARVLGRSAAGRRETTLEADGAGHWRVIGVVAPQLTGCLDVDLESSAFTNALPVHRLALSVGQEAAAPAAWVRAADLSVERLEQRYKRVADDGSRERYEYAAPSEVFESVLTYDASGLVLQYPGIATRVS